MSECHAREDNNHHSYARDDENPYRDQCPICGNSISISPTREGVEYGHALNSDHVGGGRCPRRPDCVDTTHPAAARPQENRDGSGDYASGGTA